MVEGIYNLANFPDTSNANYKCTVGVYLFAIAIILHLPTIMRTKNKKSG